MNNNKFTFKQIVVGIGVFVIWLGIFGFFGLYDDATQEPMHARNLGGPYVGSMNSDKYHLTSCEWAHEIKEENAISWEKESDAVYYGYTPCQVCRP